MPFTVIIPARYASTRLPGKPLSDIAGKPMIQRVYEQALSSEADRVVVATDDQRVVDAVEGFGGQVCMTSPSHPSGTDRIHEVATQLGLGDDAIVVNVQGDEPLIPPAVINQVAHNLQQQPKASAATLSESITTDVDWKNPNIVKVVASEEKLALYFSRAQIPFARDLDQANMIMNHGDLIQRHIGIYAYRVKLLNQFVQWHPAPLEVVECLEQLRILYHGHSIHIEVAVENVPGGIDTPEDLLRIQQEYAHD